MARHAQGYASVDHYQHYKGGQYTVIGNARHTETREILVVYTDKNGLLWTRPAKEFYGDVVINGVRVPRFLQLSDV